MIEPIQNPPLDERPEEPTIEQRREAMERAEACSQALSTVLEKFQCQIVPMLTQEPVGSGPTVKLLMGATCGVQPMTNE